MNKMTENSITVNDMEVKEQTEYGFAPLVTAYPIDIEQIGENEFIIKEIRSIEIIDFTAILTHELRHNEKRKT